MVIASASEEGVPAKAKERNNQRSCEGRKDEFKFNSNM
jgi:hypothetical protein